MVMITVQMGWEFRVAAADSRCPTVNIEYSNRRGNRGAGFAALQHHKEPILRGYPTPLLSLGLSPLQKNN